MDADFDADLEQLEASQCTVKPHDELDVLARREQETDDLLDRLFEE